MSSLLDACYLLVVPSQQSEHLRRPVGVDTCTYVPPSRVGLAAYCGCQSRASASPFLGQHGRSWISQPDCQVPNLHKRATLACLEQHFEQVSIYIYGILCSITSRSYTTNSASLRTQRLCGTPRRRSTSSMFTPSNIHENLMYLMLMLRCAANSVDAAVDNHQIPPDAMTPPHLWMY